MWGVVLIVQKRCGAWEQQKFYYSEKAMRTSLETKRSYIYNALLKHGLDNFSLTILEYCEASKCIEREDYYFKLISPEYNILSKAGSCLGRTLSEGCFANKKKFLMLQRK